MWRRTFRMIAGCAYGLIARAVPNQISAAATLVH